MNPFVHKTETRLFLNLQLLARVLTECKHGLKKLPVNRLAVIRVFYPCYYTVLCYCVTLLYW